MAGDRRAALVAGDRCWRSLVGAAAHPIGACAASLMCGKLVCGGPIPALSLLLSHQAFASVASGRNKEGPKELNDCEKAKTQEIL